MHTALFLRHTTQLGTTANSSTKCKHFTFHVSPWKKILSNSKTYFCWCAGNKFGKRNSKKNRPFWVETKQRSQWVANPMPRDSRCVRVDVQDDNPNILGSANTDCVFQHETENWYYMIQYDISNRWTFLTDNVILLMVQKFPRPTTWNV